MATYRYTILIPAGRVTGGPEALHQLSDALLAHGRDARVWYVSRENLARLDSLAAGQQSLYGRTVLLGEPLSKPDDYAAYSTRSDTRELVIDPSTVVVLPEVWLHYAPLFSPATVIIWWLSVDNAFASLARVNPNALRRPNVRHFAQSNYAASCIKALGLKLAGRLGDYTPIPPELASGSPTRSARVAINGNRAKVIANLETLAATIESHAGLKASIISGLSRESVYALFRESTVYLDLGSFPGKDRMPREALIRGCVPLLLKAGAAGCDDFELPAECLLELDADDVGIAARCAELHRETARFGDLLRRATTSVLSEKKLFDQQALTLAKRMED